MKIKELFLFMVIFKLQILLELEIKKHLF